MVLHEIMAHTASSAACRMSFIIVLLLSRSAKERKFRVGRGFRMWRVRLRFVAEKSQAVFVLDEQVEEVEIQHVGDALKQGRVDAFAFKDLVDVGAVAVELSGEPRRASALFADYVFNGLADVYFHGVWRVWNVFGMF